MWCVYILRMCSCICNYTNVIVYVLICVLYTILSFYTCVYSAMLCHQYIITYLYFMHISDNLAVAFKKYSKKRAPDTKALGK